MDALHVLEAGGGMERLPYIKSPAVLRPQTGGILESRIEMPSAYAPYGDRHTVHSNFLLASVPQETLERWGPLIDTVELPLGHMLCEAGVSPRYAYFPQTALVSLLYLMSNGDSCEIAVVGNDGVVGVSLILGGGPTTSRAVVQCAGSALRIPGAALIEEMARAGAASRLFLRYSQALLAQVTQTAACGRHHTIDQQFCRWLLASLDRLAGNELVMTQELIASMLGVRREGVTAAASRMQRDGLIRYSRGRIHVLDRHGLEARACECYAVVKQEYLRLFPGLRRAPEPQLPPHAGMLMGAKHG